MVWFLSQLHTEVVQVGLLLEVAITSNPKSMRQYIPTLLPALLPLLQSPLTASVVTPVILKFGKSALDDEQKYLGEQSFMLWHSFILGLSFRFLCCGGMVVRTMEIEPRIKLNHIISIVYSTILIWFVIIQFLVCPGPATRGVFFCATVLYSPNWRAFSKALEKINVWDFFGY